MYSKLLEKYDQKTAMKKDFKLLIGSAIMLLISLSYWLRSIKLGVLSFLMEMLCLTSSMCVSRGIFKVSYSTMESLAPEFMVSIGISTIYIFLIFDAWN